MASFYESYLQQCNKIRKSPSAVALEVGLSKTAVNGWKHGRSNPTDATLHKLADYFGVTVEDLTAENKKSPTPEGVELSPVRKEAWELIMKMDEDNLRRFIAAAKSFIGE